MPLRLETLYCTWRTLDDLERACNVSQVAHDQSTADRDCRRKSTHEQQQDAVILKD